MTKAFITGIAGTALSDAERTFIAGERPWGFILFKRNVETPGQVAALVGELRACLGEPDAPVLIDQEGGRVQRLGPPHWAVYPAWAAAVVHGLGTGSDTQTPWVLLITILCVLAVLATLAWRLASGWPQHQPVRLAAGVLTAVALLLVVGWARTGPLRAGWARAAGTPASLLSTGSGSSATPARTCASTWTPAQRRRTVRWRPTPRR